MMEWERPYMIACVNELLITETDDVLEAKPGATGAQSWTRAVVTYGVRAGGVWMCLLS
jgi:hypothetical protein